MLANPVRYIENVAAIGALKTLNAILDIITPVWNATYDKVASIKNN